MKKLLTVLFLLLAICTLGQIAFLRKTTPVYAAVNHIVISQIQIAGSAAGNDFIELYNPTSSPVDLNGHRLVKRTASGTSDTSIKSFTTETMVPARGYYLWANGTWTPSVTPDTTTSATIAVDNGVALRQGAEDTGTIIDSVAWGGATNAFLEGSVFPTNPVSGGSIQRKLDDTNGHGLDTNNNSSDFELLEISTPRNSLNVAPTSSISPTPSPTITITLSPTISASPTATPSVTMTPTNTPSPTLTPTMTPTSTPSVTPSPSPTVTTTVTPSPSTTPTSTVSPTQTPTMTVTPTNTVTPTPVVTVTPTPASGSVLGRFVFPSKTIECRVDFKIKVRRFFILYFPVIECSPVQ